MTPIYVLSDLAWRLGRRIEVHAQFARVDHRVMRLSTRIWKSLHVDGRLATESERAIPISSPASVINPNPLDHDMPRVSPCGSKSKDSA